MGKVKEQKEKKLAIDQILQGYIQNDKGGIFQILADNKSKDHLYLRSGNRYLKKTLLEVRQGLVDGTYNSINEHQWRKWVEQDNAKIEAMSQRILKRTILVQLLLELDDQLQEDHEGNKNFVNHLKKSQKVAERINNKLYDTMYMADKTILTNIEVKTEEVTNKLSKASLEDLVHINQLVVDYYKEPEKFQKDILIKAID